MKKVIALFVLAAGLIACTNTFAQSKIGHINFEELITMMPEKDSAEIALQNYGKEIQETVEIMSVEYNNKRNDLEQNFNTLSELIRETKMKELQDLERRVQEFQSNAQQNYQRKQMELFQPLYEKAGKAVKEIAKENGFTYVFYDNALLYFADDSQDLMPLAKTKLGIK